MSVRAMNTLKKKPHIVNQNLLTPPVSCQLLPLCQTSAAAAAQELLRIIDQFCRIVSMLRGKFFKRIMSNEYIKGSLETPQP